MHHQNSALRQADERSSGKPIQARRLPGPTQTAAAADEAEGIGSAPEPDLECASRCQQRNSEGGLEKTSGEEGDVAVGGPPRPASESSADPPATKGDSVDQAESVSMGDGLGATDDRSAITRPGADGSTPGCGDAVGAGVVAVSEDAKSVADASGDGGAESATALNSSSIDQNAEGGVGDGEEGDGGGLSNVRDARGGSAIQSRVSGSFEMKGQEAGRSNGPPVRVSLDRVVLWDAKRVLKDDTRINTPSDKQTCFSATHAFSLHKNCTDTCYGRQTCRPRALGDVKQTRRGAP